MSGPRHRRRSTTPPPGLVRNRVHDRDLQLQDSCLWRKHLQISLKDLRVSNLAGQKTVGTLSLSQLERVTPSFPASQRTSTIVDERCVSSLILNVKLWTFPDARPTFPERLPWILCLEAIAIFKWHNFFLWIGQIEPLQGVLLPRLPPDVCQRSENVTSWRREPSCI